MRRRDLLLLRADAPAAAVLSCETLFMRFVDAENAGAVDRFFANLARDLDAVDAVTLRDRAWLSRDELRVRVDALLDAFRARGGRVLG
ncbi:MAG TPA: hypothetical protein VFB07_09725 [Vicinamibacterales bacterium]|nr:hypothetical protein [Vicinamibacterales bacterium]